jgi:hypothetical protein
MPVGPLHDTNNRGSETIEFTCADDMTEQSAITKCIEDPNCYAIIRADNRCYFKTDGGDLKDSSSWVKHTTWTK